MTILGIDPGTTRIGYGIIRKERGGKAQLAACGLLKTAAGNPEGRVREVLADLKKIITAFNPDIAAIEKLFFVKNQKTGMAVAETRGAICALLGEHRIHYKEYAPREVKKIITGSGSADKEGVRKMVSLAFENMPISGPDDVSDAVAIALAAVWEEEFARRINPQ